MTAVIFDIEGTLIDCIPQSLESWRRTLEKFGLRVPTDILQLYSGMDGDDMLQILAPDMDQNRRKEALTCHGKEYKAHFLKTTRPFSDAHDVLGAFKAEGWKVGIATDCSPDELHYYLRLLKAKELIDAIACAEDARKGKPSSALVSSATKKLNVSAGEAIMIGDTPYDAEAAKSVGVRAIGVLTGGFSEDALLESGCFKVAAHLHEIQRSLCDNTMRAAV